MSRLDHLRALTAALRGDPPADADWMEVLRLANGALVTPQLHAAVAQAGALARLPDEVRTFTGEVARRNRARNRRLFASLEAALTALNQVAISPTLLKGTALWASLGRPAEFDRLMNDVDLLVGPCEIRGAVEALTAAGFRVHHAYDGRAVHVAAELARPGDVGFIDLHQRPPGPPGLAERAAGPAQRRAVGWAEVRAFAPTPAAQIVLLVLHDQFHDGDYWRGGFTLRHLLDIARLSRGPEPVDWAGALELAGTTLGRHAIEAELIAAAEFAGAEVPEAILRRPWSRLQHRRQLAQFRWPRLAKPLAAAGLASEWAAVMAHRAADRRDRARLFGEARTPWRLADRLERIRYILDGLADGKI